MATDPAASAGVPRFAAPRPTKRTCEDTPFVQVLPGSRSPCVKVRARYDFAVTLAAQGAEQGREAVQLVQSRDQSAGPEEDQCGGAVLATAQPHRPRFRRCGTGHQPDRPRLDELLRCVQPIGDISPSAAHQCLLDTLDPQQVQTAAGEEESLPVLAGIVQRFPRMFAHWKWSASAPAVW